MPEANKECCVNNCPNQILADEEIATRMCTFHINLLTRRGYFVGICWDCDSITGLYKIQRRLLGILTERCLFSKGCSKCSNNPNADTTWITILKYKPTTCWAIREDGQLVRNVPTQVTEKDKEHNGAN